MSPAHLRTLPGHVASVSALEALAVLLGRPVLVEELGECSRLDSKVELQHVFWNLGKHFQEMQ